MDKHNMTFDDVLSLVKAGFSRDDIMGIYSTASPQTIASPPTAADPEPEPASPVQVVPAAEPEPVNNSVETVQTESEEMQAIRSELEALRKAVYAGNIIGISQPAGAATAPTTEDILANILDPGGHPLTK